MTHIEKRNYFSDSSKFYVKYVAVRSLYRIEFHLWHWQCGIMPQIQ